MQIKTIMRLYFPPIRMAIIFLKHKIISTGKDMEELNFYALLVGM